MSETAHVPDDVATRHVLVVTQDFTGQLRGGFPIKVAKGAVLAVASLGQTNVHAGMGPRHPRAALIEHATATPTDVLPADEIAAGIETAAAKQASVPSQIAAREAQRQATLAADPPLTAAERVALRVLLGRGPAPPAVAPKPAA